MSDLYKNKYRIPSARLQTWDYASEAAYFVTICTKGRVCFFGNVVEGEMQLSFIGEIVEHEWLKTFEMRPDMNLLMGEYITMPNHWHGIITIGENEYNTKQEDKNEAVIIPIQSKIPSMISPRNNFGPQAKNLASVIRGFKIGVTTRARLIRQEFGWQFRYHDHIIRNQKSFDNISHYIINNPSKWKDDKFYR